MESCTYHSVDLLIFLDLSFQYVNKHTACFLYARTLLRPLDTRALLEARGIGKMTNSLTTLIQCDRGNGTSKGVELIQKSGVSRRPLQCD